MAHAAAAIVDRSRTAVGLDRTGDVGFLLFPQLARLPDGRLALAAYRARANQGETGDLVYTTSSDGGRSFAPAITLASGLTPSLRRHVPDWLGDYFGWAATASGIGAAFVDNASGFSHIAYTEVAPNP